MFSIKRYEIDMIRQTKCFLRPPKYHTYVVSSKPAVAVQEKQFLVSGVGRLSLSLDLEKLMFLNSVRFIMKDITFIGRFLKPP